MNKLVKNFLAAALTLSAAHLYAHTNKTYLASRPAGINCALESVTFNEIIKNGCNDKEAWGGSLEATLFYSKSNNPTGLGSYFGINHTNQFTTQSYNTYNGSTYVPGTSANAADFDATQLLNTNTIASLNTIQLSPSQQVYGIRFDYHQDLHNIVNGAYVRVKLPVVNVQSSLGLTVNGANANTITSALNGTLPENPVSSANAYVPLTNALISSPQNKTGIADIDLLLGYTFLDQGYCTASINLGLILPTGNVPTEVYAFEPVTGNGGHVALGAGYELSARIWGNKQENINFNSTLDYRYAFKGSEMRTLGITGYNWGQYTYTVPANNPLTFVQASAAANMATLIVDITPGSMLDTLAGFSYNNNGISIDIGYNLFYKEAGSAIINDHWISVSSAPDDTFKGESQLLLPLITIVNSEPTAVPINTTSSAVPTTSQMENFPITLFNTNSVLAQSTSHKIYGQCGYIFKNTEYPLMLSAGGHYEFAANNAAIATWGLNIKTGISF